MEGILRLAVFATVLIGMAIWEIALPRRSLREQKSNRWFNNLGLVALNTILARVIIPVTLAEVAHWSTEGSVGLLNLGQLPMWLDFVVAVVVLDLVIYGQHVAFHHIPWFWRLHQVHHADLDIDVTTGLRFHTIEILLSLLLKMAAVILLGASVAAVITFEILLNATSMFNHSNVRVPRFFDTVLRTFCVTPDFHRVHHSTKMKETNSNFGFNLPWWDYLFRTYRPQPEKGHTNMDIGLDYQRNASQTQRLDRMLWMPIALPPGGKASEPPKTKHANSSDRD